MPAVAVLAFCLTWWLACYLVGRDPGRPLLRRAAAALGAYALAVVAWAVAPGSAVAEILLCLPALLWAGVAVTLLPAEPPDGWADRLAARRWAANRWPAGGSIDRWMADRGWPIDRWAPEPWPVDRIWAVVSVVFVVPVVALPTAGKAVVLVPLAAALVLLWRARATVRPPVLPLAVTVVAALYAAALLVLLAPVGLGEPALVLAALGLDLMVLGYLVAVADAVDAGERLHPDLRRSTAGALAATLLCGGPAALSILAAPGARTLLVLQFALVAVVMTAVGLPGPVRRILDRLAFPHDDRLRLDRDALLMSAEALTRRRERHRLLVVGEEEFVRLTRRALDNAGDLGRLLRSPLIDLPMVDRRLQGPTAEQPLARAVELRAVLRESVARLRPEGPFGTTGDWRYYNALQYCSVLGLRPYERHPRTDGLDRDARRAVAWFRQHVPRRTLRQWQSTGARLVAHGLWDDLVSTDPRWLTHAVAAKRHAMAATRAATTRST